MEALEKFTQALGVLSISYFMALEIHLEMNPPPPFPPAKCSGI
jgi:hypothetical protein